MKRLVIIGLILLTGSRLFAQQERSLVKKGNELYQQKKYKDAEAAYRKAIEKKQNVEGNFNLGDALYKQKQFDKSGEQFSKLSESKNKAVASGAYYNLGNTLLENKKLEESIAAYEKALIRNPKDEEARYNLAYAQDKLKKQQQQDKNNKNKNQSKDKKKDKDKKDQDKKDQDKKDKDKKDKDKKDQDKKDQDKKDQDKKNQDQQKQQQQQKNNISKEDAQRMLDALNNNEKQTQDRLKNKKLKGEKVQVARDW